MSPRLHAWHFKEFKSGHSDIFRYPFYSYMKKWPRSQTLPVETELSLQHAPLIHSLRGVQISKRALKGSAGLI